MKQTNIIQKLIPSLINIIVVAILVSPLFILHWPYGLIKLILVILFFLYNLFFLAFFKNRDLGMIIAKTYWEKEYPLVNKLIYTIFYTGSFATLIFWIWFPMDLLLINMIFLQLPSILLTGTTLHGYLAGKMVTVVKIGE